ncbi:MAG: VOC family protein [Minwuia sp.]|nr:VOC family protein [Minwuia sp.]
MKSPTTMRVVRPTDDLGPIRRFYVDALQLSVIYSFEGHDGFDGLIVGIPGADHHLAFTRKHGFMAGQAASAENLLVFYLDDHAEWESATQRMRDHGFQPVEPHNPYWLANGETFADADGYRVVLQNSAP